MVQYYHKQFELSRMRLSNTTTMCDWLWCIMVLCAPYSLMGAASVDSNSEETNTGILGSDVIMRGLDARKHRRRRMSERARAHSDAWIQEGEASLLRYPLRCDCLSKGCEQPKQIRRRPDKEVFGFVDPSSTGAGFNWTHITTVAWATTEELRCAAHQAGARVLLAAPTFDLNQDSSISSWVNQVVRMIDTQNADGIVFDYEDPLSSEDPKASTYVSLINSTRAALKKEMLVVTCVPWSPAGIDGRYYPYKALADASDLLYVMDYDTQSQELNSACLASANAPFYGMVHGITEYLELGIEAQKLVLGVPWYGYRYPCVSGTLADARYCPLEYRPFRGVPCSDAIGVQVPFGNIVKERMIEPQWDSTMLAPFFNTMENTTKDNSLVQQYWYDDSQSLKLKYAWARSNELRGLGPYTFDDLNGAPAQEIQSMWSAFDTFLFDTASPLLDLSTT